MAIVSVFGRARESLITHLGGVTETRASERAGRAYEAGYNEGIEDEPVSGTLKRQGYKSILGNAIRNLGGLDHDKVLDTAWKLFLSNPVAGRSMRLKRDYILGSGVTPQADDDDLQTILGEFWRVNKLDGRLKKFILQLHLLGSQCYPAFVRKSDGAVRLGYIDPAQIERVVCHPENVMEKWAVVVKEVQGADAWAKRHGKRVYRIIREQESVIGDDDRVKSGQHEGKRVTADQAELEPWESEMLKAHNLTEYTGSCFYFSVNELSNQSMGFSDLLQEADWLDQLNAVLFALADREHMADFFSYDVTLDGAGEDDVRKRAGEIRKNPPRKGSVNVHNDKEAWRMDRPDLKQAGSIEASRTLLRFALGGLGLPEHWYAYGNETNRATAEAQGTPTFRSLESDQDNTRAVILEMLYFVRDQAAIAGALSGESVEVEIVLTMPEMTTKDLGAIGQSLGVVAQALLTIESLNLVTRETQAKVWAKFVSEIGVEYNPVEELEKLDEESEEDALPGMTIEWHDAIVKANGR
jgi:hypothetical protein